LESIVMNPWPEARARGAVAAIALIDQYVRGSGEVVRLNYCGYPFALGLSGAIVIVGSQLWPSSVPHLSCDSVWAMQAGNDLLQGPRKERYDDHHV
jgi:hypothetical protein